MSENKKGADQSKPIVETETIVIKTGLDDGKNIAEMKADEKERAVYHNNNFWKEGTTLDAEYNIDDLLNDYE